MQRHSPPPTEPVVVMIQGQLSTTRRWLYRVLLVVCCVVVAAISSLWMTEPRRLPLRLHIAFAASVMIGFGWICVLMWLLWRRSCFSVVDQVVTGWTATVASCGFLVVALPIAVSRGSTTSLIWLSLLACMMLVTSLFLVFKGYQFQSRLKRRRTELE